MLLITDIKPYISPFHYHPSSSQNRRRNWQSVKCPVRHALRMLRFLKWDRVPQSFYSEADINSNERNFTILSRMGMLPASMVFPQNGHDCSLFHEVWSKHTVRPRRKKKSENYNDLSKKVYTVTNFSLSSFLLTPDTRCIGDAWPSTNHFKWWCQNWFAQNRRIRA